MLGVLSWKKEETITARNHSHNDEDDRLLLIKMISKKNKVEYTHAI